MSGVNLAVGAFEIRIGHNRRSAVTGARHIDHVEIVLFDDPVQVRVDEVLARRGAPVSQQHTLDVGQS